VPKSSLFPDLAHLKAQGCRDRLGLRKREGSKFSALSVWGKNPGGVSHNLFFFFFFFFFTLRITKRERDGASWSSPTFPTACACVCLFAFYTCIDSFLLIPFFSFFFLILSHSFKSNLPFLPFPPYVSLHLFVVFPLSSYLCT